MIPGNRMTLTFQELRRYLSVKSGYGDRTVEQWGEAKSGLLARVVNRGYRMYLYPTVPGDPTRVHRWSFLTITKTLITVASTAEYDLPEDFGALYDRTLSFSPTVRRQPISVTSESVALQSSSNQASIGVPNLAVIKPRASADGSQVRFTMTLYPTPDTAYTLSYRYVCNPLPLSEDRPYPLGGPEHSETLIAAVLAAAELEIEEGPGTQGAEFQKNLIRSIAFDRDNAPDTIGVMEDPNTGCGNSYPGIYFIQYHGQPSSL